MTLTTRKSVPPRISTGYVFDADLWHPEQKGSGTLTNGTGVATPSALVADDNTVTVATLGTLIITLPVGRTGTATSGTTTVTGSPVSLVAGDNTITTTGATGNITVNVADKFVERSTNAYVCTVTGTTHGNQGRTMDGDDEINAGNSLTIAGLTIASWVKPTTITGANRRIVNKMQNAGQYMFEFLIVGTNSLLRFVTSANGTALDTLDSTVSLSLNTWYFVVAVDDLITKTIYINGVARGSQASIGLKTSSTDNLMLGSSSAGGFFIGIKGEDLIYNRALIATEIYQTFNATRWRYGA